MKQIYIVTGAKAIKYKKIKNNFFNANKKYHLYVE